MTTSLNLADIQGNVVRAYGSFGYSSARYFFLNIANGDDKGPEAREFIAKLLPHVTTAQRWKRTGDDTTEDRIDRPPVTLNLAFTFYGLWKLGLPTRTLKQMPDEYIDGMAKRAKILGDVGHNGQSNWDKIWQEETDTVHIWISMNALGGDVSHLDEQTELLRKLVDESNGAVKILSGIGPDNADYQDAQAKMVETEKGARPTRKEHFGFNDGYGNPVFEGQFDPDVEATRVIGRGKLMPDQTWKPLATGEFILGHSDESQQLPTQARPWEFTHNGTFLVYRKLHQNVKSFKDYIAEEAEKYASINGVPTDEANVTIRAKMAGRWPDGIPLVAAPTHADWIAAQEKWKGKINTPEYQRFLMDFKYGDDKEGLKCPVTAHIRRANTRDMLDPSLAPGNEGDDLNGSVLNKRRRILRRGLPYGPFEDTDKGEHGTIFIVVCASIFRQFEFVQQQWIQYGLDFNAGNDTCPIIGTHKLEDDSEKGSKFVIASDPATKKPPFICADMPNFVSTRGGEYFFLPSMTALNMIAKGTVDPT